MVHDDAEVLRGCTNRVSGGHCSRVGAYSGRRAGDGPCTAEGQAGGQGTRRDREGGRRQTVGRVAKAVGRAHYAGGCRRPIGKGGHLVHGDAEVLRRSASGVGGSHRSRVGARSGGRAGDGPCAAEGQTSGQGTSGDRKGGRGRAAGRVAETVGRAHQSGGRGWSIGKGRHLIHRDAEVLRGCASGVGGSHRSRVGTHSGGRAGDGPCAAECQAGGQGTRRDGEGGRRQTAGRVAKAVGRAHHSGGRGGSIGEGGYLVHGDAEVLRGGASDVGGSDRSGVGARSGGRAGDGPCAAEGQTSGQGTSGDRKGGRGRAAGRVAETVGRAHQSGGRGWSIGKGRHLIHRDAEALCIRAAAIGGGHDSVEGTCCGAGA